MAVLTVGFGSFMNNRYARCAFLTVSIKIHTGFIIFSMKLNLCDGVQTAHFI